jgi:RNA polymerase sigma factor (TIGR02999 family)
MAAERKTPITVVLEALQAGDPRAAEELLPLVYDELRLLAKARMAQEGPGQTLQPTALVHEAYMRVLGENASWENRQHFFAAAARAMRQILVEQARRKARVKHGGELKRRHVADLEPSIEPPVEDVLAVDEALQKLETIAPDKAQLVNYRYFAGMTNEETAQIVGVSVTTIERRWRFIRTWLQRELAGNCVD